MHVKNRTEMGHVNGAFGYTTRPLGRIINHKFSIVDGSAVCLSTRSVERCAKPGQFERNIRLTKDLNNGTHLL